MHKSEILVFFGASLLFCQKKKDLGVVRVHYRRKIKGQRE